MEIGCANGYVGIPFLLRLRVARGRQVLYKSLENGGKVFFSMSSLYVKFFGRFIDEYEKKVAANAQYPGWMNDVSQYLAPHQIEYLPSSMHYLDSTILTRVFSEARFTIESSEFFKRGDVTKAMCLDGSENVGLIARK